jgi:hypothetical protein
MDANQNQAEQPLLQHQLYPLIVKRCQELTGKKTLSNENIRACFFKATGKEIGRDQFCRMQTRQDPVSKVNAQYIARFLDMPIEKIALKTFLKGREAKQRPTLSHQLANVFISKNTNINTQNKGISYVN